MLSSNKHIQEARSRSSSLIFKPSRSRFKSQLPSYIKNQDQSTLSLHLNSQFLSSLFGLQDWGTRLFFYKNYLFFLNFIKKIDPYSSDVSSSPLTRHNFNPFLISEEYQFLDQPIADLSQIPFSLSQVQVYEHVSESTHHIVCSNAPSEPSTLPSASQDAPTSSRIFNFNIWNHFENLVKIVLGRLDVNIFIFYV